MAIELSPEDRALVEEVREKFELANKLIHTDFRRKGEHLYSQYRSYKDFRHSYTAARDKDAIIRDGQKEWGAELFIPYTFATVETMAPRMLSNRPKMLILPRAKASEKNVENMKFMIDAQQEAIEYELVLQDVAKAGLIYNLGVQKTFWQRRTRKTTRLVQRLLPTGEPSGDWMPEEYDKELFDGPVAEDVDPFDFFWDPFAHDVGSAEWLIHRTWRSTDYVLKRMKSGVWRSFEEDDVRGMAPWTRYGEVFNRRRQIEGFTAHAQDPSGLSNRHEVWEFHDGERVVTVLNGQYIVQNGRNPAWHCELPFQIYRPIRVPKHFIGIGAVEPIEDLQEEMNTMRRQRRDKATIAINMPFAFHSGIINAADLKFGPNIGIPVNGEPRDLLYPLQTADVPNSGYQEEARLAADIERTTGLADATQGGQSTAETATGAQLQVAAANIRIQLMTLRLEKEVAKPAGSQWVALNQQKIRDTREVRREVDEYGARRWEWFEIGPAELQGEFLVEVAGGSTAPLNVPQDRQDAQFASQLLGNDPQIDRRQLTRWVLDKLGVKQPDAWLLPDQRVPPAFVELMRRQMMQASGEQGVALVDQTLQLAQQLEEQQRNAPPQPAGSQNGAQPEPAGAAA